MAKPKMIGSIGCFVETEARLGDKAFTFDGTTADLTRRAVANGAKVGDTIRVEFAQYWMWYVLQSAPHDPRCGGVWASEISPRKLTIRRTSRDRHAR